MVSKFFAIIRGLTKPSINSTLSASRWSKVAWPPGLERIIEGKHVSLFGVASRSCRPSVYRYMLCKLKAIRSERPPLRPSHVGGNCMQDFELKTFASSSDLGPGDLPETLNAHGCHLETLKTFNSIDRHFALL